MKKSLVSALIICSLTVTSFIFVGCGGKKEPSITDKVIKVAGDEIKGRLTGEVKTIAQYGLDYDHEALERIVKDPNNAKSKAIAERLYSQIERSQTKLFIYLGREEVTNILLKINDSPFKTKINGAIKQGKDLNDVCLLIEDKKMLAYWLQDSVVGSASTICTTVREYCGSISGSSKKTIDIYWKKLLIHRAALQDMIDGKPVIIKESSGNLLEAKQIAGNGKNFSSEDKQTNNNNTKSEVAMDKTYLGKWSGLKPGSQNTKTPNTITITKSNSQTGGYEVELFFYRIANATGYAKIDGNKLSINQGDIMGKKFRGTIEKTNKGIRLTITESDFEYIKPGSVYEYIK